MIIPRDSAWFSFFDEQGKVVPVNETDLFTAIGLKQLYDKGKMHFLSLPGGHMQFSMEDFEELAKIYLGGKQSVSALLTFQIVRKQASKGMTLEKALLL
jgi:palmitoyl-protein thioesterase